MLISLPRTKDLVVEPKVKRVRRKMKVNAEFMAAFNLSTLVVGLQHHKSITVKFIKYPRALLL